jgi:outer membrane lipoprotein-sorting protein
MRGRRLARTALLLAIASGFLAGTLVEASAIPMPRLRPAYKGPPTTVAPGPVDPTAAIAAAPLPAFNPNSRFSRDQQIALAGINNYFNSFRQMEGQFVQFGPRGEQSEGVFFLSRPGLIRFHFNPPSKLDIISNGDTVAVRDGRAGTQDLYPLSKTPLRYLLADRIDLTSDNIVQQVKQEADLTSIVIVERAAFAEGKLTLIFDRKTYRLRQWIVTDAQGLNTSVNIYNTETGKPQNPNLYRIDMSQR